MECYRLNIPEDARLAGHTAQGERVSIRPGEYLVHRLRPKVPMPCLREVLRFVGADGHGRDVHVVCEALPLAGLGEHA